MEIRARLIERFDVTTHGESFKKQEFVVETLEEKYVQTIKLQATQERIEKIAALKIGGVYNFHFNLRGRKWISPENKTVYFNTIEVWRVEKDEEYTEIATIEVAAAENKNSFNDDLPF